MRRATALARNAQQAYKLPASPSWSVASLLQHSASNVDIDLERLERLSCIRIADSDRQAVCTSLKRYASFIQQVQDIDTSDVEPTISLSTWSVRLRNDVEQAGLGQECIRSLSKHTLEGYHVAPKESYFKVDSTTKEEASTSSTP
eukprot:TRINITY_DN9121_c0_g3_i2.p4 TRINITY_DN9121_c0_g3~~TRINITY_DN9121_c0_g3_i2.p4  ORF type:complete len:145 (+),score=22.25 TRINITY_DN9121_c0_g3_i2:3-437(+)